MTMRLLSVLIGLLLAACQPDARPVRIGEECAHCRMQVMAPQYAAEMITKKGRQYVFDDVSCLVRFLQEDSAKAGQAAQLLVADYQAPAHWVPVAQASFVQSDQLRTPMNGQTVALATDAAARALSQQFSPAGTIMAWPQVQRELAR